MHYGPISPLFLCPFDAKTFIYSLFLAFGMRRLRGVSPVKSFFQPRKILSPRLAFFFAVEEAIMVLLLVFQIYRFLGIEVVNQQAFFFTNPILLQNILWFVATVLFFVIGYAVVALRDENVWLIHKNFSRMVFGTTRLKIQFASRRKVVFLFAEIVYSLVFALSIFVYLDPDINVLPSTTPKIINYIGFAIMVGIGLLLFSHTKNFRAKVYGATPAQKRFQIGRHELRRFTNKKTGSIRIAPKSHYKKK